MRPSVLIFSGSNRAGSLNEQLADVVAGFATQAGAQVRRLRLRDYPLPLYSADLDQAGPPPAACRLPPWRSKRFLRCTRPGSSARPNTTAATRDCSKMPSTGFPVRSRTIRSGRTATGPSRARSWALLSASPGGLGGVRSLDPLQTLLSNLRCWVSPYRYALARADQALQAAEGLPAASAFAVREVVRKTLWAAKGLQLAGHPA